MFDGTWQLPLLQVLVFKASDCFKITTGITYDYYTYFKPFILFKYYFYNVELLTRMLNACENIQELHLMGFVDAQAVDFLFSSIQQQELKMLNVHYLELPRPVTGLPMVNIRKYLLFYHNIFKSNFNI